MDNIAKAIDVIIGNIDIFDGNNVRGWVKSDTSSQSLVIDVYINDKAVCYNEIASSFRSDVEEAGYSDGRYGFDIFVAEGYAPFEENVKVSIRLSGSESVLLSAEFCNPVKVRSELEAETFESISEPFIQTLAGNIEGFSDRRVVGWFTNLDDPTPQAFDLYFDEICMLQRCVADRFREDVLDAGFGDGRCGFDLNIESSPHFPGNGVRVSLRSSDTNVVLIERWIEGHPFKDKYVLRLDKTDDAVIKGWFINYNRPKETFGAELFLNDVFYRRVTNSDSRKDLLKKNISGGLGGFLINSPIPHMPQTSHSVSFRFPDGSYSATLTIDAKTQRTRPVLIADIALVQRVVTIIVPIYNAPEDVETCIERLLRYTPPWAQILLIDDCSPNPVIAEILEGYKDNLRLRIARNEKNLGFTRTINYGLTITGDHDVVLLNSDARVTPGWLEGMIVAAASSPRIATVTAMSDRAGAFSAPQIGNDNSLPDGFDEIVYAKAFRRHSLGLYPQVPTGNGFCMYISRAAIKALGVLDADAFPRGYGEENDFCMRALRAGWLNVIDDRTYVFHERSKSFGEAKTELLAQGRNVIDARYPDYKTAISIFHTDEKILLARYFGAVALRECLNHPKALPRVLYVVATQTGGTPQTNRDLMEALGDALETFVLRCDGITLEVAHVTVGSAKIVKEYRLQRPIEPFSHRSGEYDAVVAQWIFDLDVDVLHIRHLAWHSLSLPELAKRLGKKVMFSFHDFYTLTPTVKLIDDSGTFLGETYYPEGSIYRENLWHGVTVPAPIGDWLDGWRKRFAEVLKYCDAFVTTSTSARELILEKIQIIDPKKFFVIPHGRDFEQFETVSVTPVHGQPVRILIPGNISMAKGLNVIFDLLEHDFAGLLEFHVLGKIQVAHPRIITHGSYDRGDFAKKATAIRPHLGAVFSIWDETYCHTLTELWSIGVPSIVFDFPTLARRMASSGCGWVMDHRDIVALYENILKVSFDSAEQQRAGLALRQWQSGYGVANSVRMMASRYFEIYCRLMNDKLISVESEVELRIGVVGQNSSLSSSSVAPMSTSRISTMTRNSVGRGAKYIDMTAQTMLANAQRQALDRVVIDQYAIPRTMVNEFITISQQLNLPYIIDVSEDIFSEASDRSMPVAAASADYLPFLKKLIQSAAHVTSATRDLLETVRKLNSNATVVGPLIEDHFFYRKSAEERGNRPVSAVFIPEVNANLNLETILPQVEFVANQHPGFHLTVLCNHANLDSRWKNLDWLEFASIEEPLGDSSFYISYLKKRADEFDFALMPYFDLPRQQAQLLQKLMTYSALGLSIVTSPLTFFPTDAPGIIFTRDGEQGLIDALNKQIELVQNSPIDRTSQVTWAKRASSSHTMLTLFDEIVAKVSVRSNSL